MKKIKIFFYIFDSFFVIFLIVVLLCPDSLGKTFLDICNLKLTSGSTDKIIAMKNSNIDYIDTKEYKKSDDSFEETILNKDPDNDIYKLISFNIDNYSAYMMIVYDPSKIKLMVGNGFSTPFNNGKINVANMLKKYDAIAGINAGGFYDNGVVSNDTPEGYIIKDGEILWDSNKQGNLIGFNYDNKLTLISATGEEAISQGIRDAIEFGPFLIVNNEVTPEAIAMSDRRASRAVIAQREDGIVLMLVTEGGSFTGAKMSDIINVLKQYKAINAANLDGGLSSQLVVNDKNYVYVTDMNGYTSNYGRKVVNGWGIFN